MSRLLLANDVAQAMRAMEESVEAEIGRESPPLDLVIATWTRVEYGGAELIVPQEVQRAVELSHSYYGKVAERVRILTPALYAGVGFLQGVTWAVAAERMRARDARSG